MSQGVTLPPVYDAAALIEKGEAREWVARGRFLQVARDTVRLPDGHRATREFVVHPGAVAVVALADDGQVVLERQFRYPVGLAMIEFPAGKLDPGESSLACAQRELREETGFVASEWAWAGVMHLAVGYSTEHIDLWFARGLTQGERDLDDGEFLDVFLAPLPALRDWVRQGLVTDAKTLTCLYWLEQVQGGHWSLDWAGPASPVHPQPCGPYRPPVPGERD